MHTDVWQQALAEIASSVDEQRYQTWFAPLRVVPRADPAEVVLAAPNRFVSDFLDQHYRDKLLAILSRLNPTIARISFAVDGTPRASDDGEPAAAAEASPTRPRQNSSVGLNRRFVFDSFVVGAGNQFAKSAALAVAEAPGKTKFNPLLIYGGVGLGKTHLLQAVGNAALTRDASAKVTYLTSEDFYLQFIDGIKNNNTRTFSQKYRSCDVLLVDDIQFFAGKESTQEEFFYTFNALYQNGKQIVLTSDLPPGALQGLQDRLISRFQWGLCVDIQPPDLETRVAILKRKAEEDNLSIPENVLYFIGETVPSNIRELEGIVIRLLAYASIAKTDITIDLVNNLLKRNKPVENTRVSIEDIIQKVATYYKIPVNNVRDKNRRKEVAQCRHVAMYVAKQVTTHSLKTIGLNFGGRDHSTVIHALHQIEDQCKKDETLRKEIEYIVSSLRTQ